jgi:hypothetical protein
MQSIQNRVFAFCAVPGNRKFNVNNFSMRQIKLEILEAYTR